jgi:hypothetical protein
MNKPLQRALIIACALLPISATGLRASDQIVGDLDWPAIQARLTIVAEEFDLPQTEFEDAMNDPHGAGLVDFAGRHDLSLDWIVSGDSSSERLRTGSLGNNQPQAPRR